MKRSRFTDEQIAYALRQVYGGTAVAALAISNQLRLTHAMPRDSPAARKNPRREKPASLTSVPRAKATGGSYSAGKPRAAIMG
jgi:hypothetical protein